jgi:type VI secretion system secreted protein VgrG
MADHELKAELTFGKHDGPLTVLALRGTEEISRPFRYELDFTAENLDLEAAPLSRVHLRIEDPGGAVRHLDAVCQSIAFVPLAADDTETRMRYRAVLVPAALVVLGHRHGFRIHQKKSVAKIAQRVWQDCGLDAAWLEVSALQASYPARDFCCQYDETEWDFVSRLLEDEGIAYVFRHTEDAHVLELHDRSADLPTLVDEPLPFKADPLGESSGSAVWDWRSAARLRPGKVTLWDHDFEAPSRSLEKEASTSEVVERLFYESPGGYVLPKEGDRRVKTRLEEQRTGSRTARFKTSELTLASGRRFSLSGHPADDGDYVLTRVELFVRFHAEDVAGPLTDTGLPEVRLVGTCIPRDLPFRPARLTPKPRIPGLQTARVTGPKGSEIHCDKHGRVKVQLHWDPEGQLDDATSAWIRVSQPHNTGAVLIPRVGWEVLVEFEHGDLDRPYVLGRLWNAEDAPPVSLPAGRTQTVHASQSSPGGGKANEVVFEDSAGAEQMHVRGGHDILVNAGNDKVFNVGHDLGWTVHGKRSLEVGGDRTVTVGANLKRRVGGDEKLQVAAQHTIDVSGSATEDALANRTLTVGGAHMVQVGNPAQAVLEVLKKAAITAATGAAAAAASRAEAALLGPILPVVQKARQALGNVSQITGPAAALLGPDHPKIAALNDAAKSLADSPGAQDASDLASGMVAKALGDSGGDAAAEAAASATQGGSGLWATVVDGNVTETVGGLCSVNSIGGISLSVGGKSSETAGAARIEAIGGVKEETTKGAKVETVGGLYRAELKEALAIQAGSALAENVAGAAKHHVKGSHSMSAKQAVIVTTPKITLKANGTITLTCGSTKVVLKSSGVDLEGDSALTLKASKVELDEGVLGGP